tara:strand:- start:31 stop:228 length:198 start_codon:yes stop_codon:yes gene_type:complete
VEDIENLCTTFRVDEQGLHKLGVALLQTVLEDFLRIENRTAEQYLIMTGAYHAMVRKDKNDNNSD